MDVKWPWEFDVTTPQEADPSAIQEMARNILSYDLPSWTYYAIAPGRRPIMSPFEWRLVLLFAAVTVVPFLLGFFFALGERFAAWGFGKGGK